MDQYGPVSRCRQPGEDWKRVEHRAEPVADLLYLHGKDCKITKTKKATSLSIEEEAIYSTQMPRKAIHGSKYLASHDL